MITWRKDLPMLVYKPRLWDPEKLAPPPRLIQLRIWMRDPLLPEGIWRLRKWDEMLPNFVRLSQQQTRKKLWEASFPSHHRQNFHSLRLLIAFGMAILITHSLPTFDHHILSLFRTLKPLPILNLYPWNLRLIVQYKLMR